MIKRLLFIVLLLGFPISSYSQTTPISTTTCPGAGAAPTFRVLVPADMTPAGSTTEVQFNSEGVLAGAASLTYATAEGTTTGRYITSGTTPTVANVGADSCGTTAATIAGNSNSGRVTVGATAGTQCRITTTITAPTGWNCTASNTVTAALARCIGVDTTHFDLVGVFTAADIIAYVAFPN